jgi:hypothetical protein
LGEETTMAELVSITDGGSDAELEKHITALFNEDTALQSAAVVYFRQLVSPEQQSTQVSLCERHVIDRLVDILRQSDPLVRGVVSVCRLLSTMFH